MNSTADKMFGHSPVFTRALNAARMVAGTDAPVLIAGEPGSGKALMAREIHAASRHSKGEFRVIGCAGIDACQLEAALMATANGSTLYLDEVADLSLETQAKLLHFIESVEARHSGFPAVRVLASTGTDLMARQLAGQFREDLYYRLHVVPLVVPPLRERGDDIVLLLKQFTADLARYHGRKAPRYSVTARNLVKQYRWPGNVRELRNFCERMVILMPGAIVQPADMPPEMRRDVAIAKQSGLFSLPENGIDLFELEGDIIRQALSMSGGNRSKAARLLGLTRDTLLYRIQKHAIET
ncbi:sigma 54-interacting transcriptional regulator [Sedimenticola sp.]|uniref:sigma 54-interacting transcriptional regulator n=1 Tax=Sedimenticola sp. TaxID=1940285 RepID=UPI003D0FEAF6